MDERIADRLKNEWDRTKKLIGCNDKCWTNLLLLARFRIQTKYVEALSVGLTVHFLETMTANKLALE